MTYGQMVPYRQNGQMVASSGGQNTFDNFREGYRNAPNSRFDGRPVTGIGARMAGTGRQFVGNAMAGARGAYGAVKSFIPAAGGVLAVVGGGLEAKARLDRGEDGQRAATGGIVSTVAGLVGGGLGLVASRGNLAAAAAGSAAASSGASWVNDRVTDLVRGNDGKGTDAVVQDLDGQITAAQGRGDIAKATQLIAQQGLFVAERGRQNESPYQQGNRADAGSYGVGPDGMPEFNAAKNMAGIDEMQSDATFSGGQRRGQRAFEQNLRQEGVYNAYNDPRLEKIRQQMANTSRASQYALSQSRMIEESPRRMNEMAIAAMNSAAQSASFAPR